MNWVSIAFKVFANREKFAKLYEQVKPLIRELPQVAELLKEIDPELGASGPDTKFSVEWMQESLNTLTKSNLVVDGDYGELTRAAVRNFQAKHDLDPDGWAGIQTCVKIYQELHEA